MFRMEHSCSQYCSLCMVLLRRPDVAMPIRDEGFLKKVVKKSDYFYMNHWMVYVWRFIGARMLAMAAFLKRGGGGVNLPMYKTDWEKVKTRKNVPRMKEFWTPFWLPILLKFVWAGIMDLWALGPYQFSLTRLRRLYRIMLMNGYLDKQTKPFRIVNRESKLQSQKPQVWQQPHTP